MKIILIRHGMTEGNLKRRYIGTTDEDLINTDCLKGDYPKCERIVASPLKRCIQTAEYIYIRMWILKFVINSRNVISAILRINHTRI